VVALSIAPDWIVGRAELDGPNNLVFRREASGETVPWRAIQRLEVHVRPRTSRTQAALIGFVGGALVGFSVFKLWADATYSNDEWNNAAGLFLAAPLTGTLGAVIGSAAARPRWQAVGVAGLANP
jgi:hypothetical protein